MNLKLKPNKHDIFVLIGILLILIVTIISSFATSSSEDNVVVIRYNNEVVHKMNLEIDERFTMKQEDYDLLLGDLTVEVKNGKVAVVEQTSNHNYCQIMGAVDKKGTAIICAPNGVVITIEGHEEVCSDWGPCLGGDS